MPGRMVRSQEPKVSQTSLGAATARYWSNPWATTPAWMKGMIGAHFASDTVSVIVRLAMKILIAIAGAQRNHVLHPEMVGE